jgi:hypothetical protein
MRVVFVQGRCGKSTPCLTPLFCAFIVFLFVFFCSSIHLFSLSIHISIFKMSLLYKSGQTDFRGANGPKRARTDGNWQLFFECVIDMSMLDTSIFT